MTDHPGETTEEHPAASVTTVEAVVRAQLSKALGGRRGMVEAAVPTLIFTVCWLTTKELHLSLVISVAAAVVLLVLRLVQRSTVQFVVNALVGIGIGWLFVTLSARNGGSADDQALAYFLPGILYNSVYTVILGFTCLIGWPLVGFMVGSVTGDPTAWHADRPVVKLCTRLTWLLALPCLVRVLVQAPIWLAGHSGSIHPRRHALGARTRPHADAAARDGLSGACDLVSSRARWGRAAARARPRGPRE
jgi:hypothetical protein